MLLKTQKNMHLEFDVMLVLATNHLSNEDRLVVEAIASGARDYGHVYNKGEYGWFIWTGMDVEEIEQQHGLALPSLKACIAFAREHEATWLMLDRDASDIAELPTYEW